MNKTFLSYLDDFNNIVVIIKKKLLENLYTNETFLLLDRDNNVVTDLKIVEKYDEYDTLKLVLFSDVFIIPSKDYYIEAKGFDLSFLLLGAITRSSIFDKMYTYTSNDLGANYYKEYTIFKVWSPVSKEMYLEIISLDGVFEEYKMELSSTGVYSVTVYKDLELAKYRYKFRINKDYQYAIDPYTISSTITQKYSYILNPDKFYKFVNKRPNFNGIYNDAIIYEASIRDLTSFYNESTFDAIERHDLLKDIKTLGATHIQFMPLYRFYGIDPVNKLNTYNWGYNPENYNEVEISYSDDINDPYRAINGLRKLVDYCFKENLLVNMDVVFNHVYDIEKFNYQLLVPGYFYWYDSQKIRTEFSFCGNDLNSKRTMVKKLIVDSLSYWMNTFNICGFRFDLMGLLDLDSLNYFTSHIKSLYDKAMVYGEGWHMKSLLRNNEKASIPNSEKMPKIAFFNDFFRDHIRSKDMSNKGFIDGNLYEISDVIESILGTKHLFKNSNQSINYLECHDNYTLYDQLKVNEIDSEKIFDLHILGTSIVIISLGIPFLHSGQEFFRTKQLVENSYNSLDKINKIDYDRKKLYDWYQNIIRDLICIRNEYAVFRKECANHIEVIKSTSHEIILCYRDINYNLYCIIKNDYKLFNYDFKLRVKSIFNGRHKENLEVKNILLSKPGVYIYKKEV